MKKNMKKIMFSSVILLCIISISSCAFGFKLNPKSIVKNPDSTGIGPLVKMGNLILGIFQAVGAGVAMVATLVLALRYMYSSPDDKAEIKKKLIPYIIGGVLVFGAVQLVKIVEVFTGELIK